MLEQLTQLLLQRPFRPFSLITDDDRRLNIVRRHQVAVGVTQLAYVWPGSDSTVTIKLNRIKALLTEDESRVNQ